MAPLADRPGGHRQHLSRHADRRIATPHAYGGNGRPQGAWRHHIGADDRADRLAPRPQGPATSRCRARVATTAQQDRALPLLCAADPAAAVGVARSEEHTSELQSLMRISYAVFCLKKKTTISNIIITFY